MSRAKIINGPFYPSGTIQRPTFLKGRLDECMMALCRTLSDDWPTGFLQIFEDKSGGIVMSFDKNRAVAEGDLSSYMNQLSKVNNHVLSYGLTKDSTQWGMVDEDTQSVFFVFWAPWVRHKYLGSSATQPLNSQRRSAEQPGGSDDEDNEDGGGNDGGGQPASSLPTGGGGVLGSGPGVGGTGGGMYGSAASGPGMLGSARPNPIRAR